MKTAFSGAVLLVCVMAAVVPTTAQGAAVAADVLDPCDRNFARSQAARTCPQVLITPVFGQTCNIVGTCTKYNGDQRKTSLDNVPVGQMGAVRNCNGYLSRIEC